MTDTQRLQLHRFLLISLRTIGERGHTAAILASDARAELAIEIDETHMLGELRTLSSQRLVSSIDVPLAGVRWIITSRGRAMLAEAGL